ncbi:hypothetical protein GP486_002609 [Trichoglossum hirsutum]|uniref:Uncharacterized protein n=1 Tax=Trichoglossum hirsutum TaxID=265104 RepID=A0A9P8LES1_9PEZI|nr:hypothetical protein GP486_002609 [Trichoglossum hirsutum]
MNDANAFQRVLIDESRKPLLGFNSTRRQFPDTTIGVPPFATILVLDHFEAVRPRSHLEITESVMWNISVQVGDLISDRANDASPALDDDGKGCDPLEDEWEDGKGAVKAHHQFIPGGPAKDGDPAARCMVRLDQAKGDDPRNEEEWRQQGLEDVERCDCLLGPDHPVATHHARECAVDWWVDKNVLDKRLWPAGHHSSILRYR